jgi:hypothetical protein
LLESYQGNYETRRQLWIANAEAQESDALSLGLACMKTGANHYVLHTGNKPSGFYTGNGDATARTIETGGAGNVVAIFASGALAFIGLYGGLYSMNGSVTGIKGDVIKFENGVLTIKSASAFNASGVTYSYQVL